MMKRRELIRIVDAADQIPGLLSWLESFVRKGLPGGPVQVTIGRERRSKDQNSKLWPMLTDISEQVDWHGNRPTPEEWKHIFTAALEKQRVYPGLDGGFVVCGLSTSRMRKKLFCDLVELIYAFGGDHGVEWSEPPKDAEELWKGAA